MILVVAERVNDPGLSNARVERWARAWRRHRLHCILSTPAMYRSNTRAMLKGILGFEPEVRNLLWPDNRIGTWDRVEAIMSALLLRNHVDLDYQNQRHFTGMILLGRRVAEAFDLGHIQWGYGPPLMGWPVPTLVLPHPSGRNRIWNDPAMRRAMNAAVSNFLEVTNGKPDQASQAR